MKLSFCATILATVMAAGQTINTDAVAGDGEPMKGFIPIQLFTGAEWEGTEELALTPVNTIARPQGDPPMSVKGPVWSEKTNQYVIERDRISRSAGGRVYQQYAINGEKDGLRMVYEERGQRVRFDNTISKFPLGWWRQGETRKYDDTPKTRITIMELDYTFSDLPHCLKFRWTTNYVSD